MIGFALIGGLILNIMPCFTCIGDNQTASFKTKVHQIVIRLFVLFAAGVITICVARLV
ncbi:hypothetical protein OK016_25260 [Vibrio chagasii]|nr:hypothetical protein [Vibrio chagasii]